MKPLTRRAVEVTARASSPSPSAPSTPSDAARRRASNAASSSVVARRRAATEKSPPLSSSSSSSLSTLDAPSSRAREELTHRAARTASKRARGDDEREDDARLKLARRSRARHARETAQARGVTVRSLEDVARRDAGAGAGAASCALTPPVTPFAGSASGREARTRRETALRARREANEAASGLLGTLCEDALWMVCSRLSALDLVALEQTSAYFRESARVKDRGLGLCERIAHERVRGVPMVGMPPFYRKASWKQKLRIIEQRAEKINTETLKPGMWLRVRDDADLVKRMCVGADKSVVGYPVGWETGMEKTCGKCYRVTVISREYRQTPVIGLSVAEGLVAISRGATSTYGWYFPVEALEVRATLLIFE